MRFVQGWVAEAGVQCARLAQRGVTGPVNWLTGHYGFGHLYGRDTLDPEAIAANLGQEWRLHRMVFKKYPSCGVTQGLTELALALVARGLRAEDVRSVQVRLPPYAFKLVGKAFDPGANPRVDAQFSAAYCVANALVRRASTLQHFAPAQVFDRAVREMIERVEVVADPAMNVRGHAAVDLDVTTNDGLVLRRALDIPPGFPGADLDDAQHLARFQDCLGYAPRCLPVAQVDRLLAALQDIARLDDVRSLVPMLVASDP